MKISEQDLVVLLQAVGAAKVDPQLRQLLLREWFCWKWTTRQGKYFGCRYWSDRAILQSQYAGDSGLRHEHIIPRAKLAEILERKLNANNGVSLPADEWATWLRRMCAGCVITEEEDACLGGCLSSGMPDDWDESDAWMRYRQAFRTFGITVWEVGPNLERGSKQLELPSQPPPPASR